MLSIVFAAAEPSHVGPLVERYRDAAAVDAALNEVRGFWNGLLGTVTIRTPDRAMDLIVNRWLLYQTLACRIWGRSAFYQSGGAFGYRDQLQDAAALVHHRPALTRAQIVLHARHQFVDIRRRRGGLQHRHTGLTGRGHRA